MAITTVHNELIAVNAISGTLIADNAITATHIATNAVSGTLIADNGITTVHIAQNNVTSTSIVANAITSTQLADNAVIANKIPDGTIATAHLADNAVTAAKIPDNVLTATMLPDNVILATHIPNATAPTFANTTVSNLYVADDIGHTGDSDTYLSWDANNLSIYNGGVQSMYMDASEVVVNNASGDVNFRVESNNQTHMLFVDGGNDKVGIGMDTPAGKLHIQDTSATSVGILLTNSNNTAGAYSDLKWCYSSSDQSYGSGLRFKQLNTTHGGQLEFFTDNTSGTYTQRMTITEDGNVGIGTTSPSEKLFIENTTDSTDVGLTVRNTGSAGGEDAMINLYAHASGGDPAIRWHITGTESWTMGLDNSDSDKLMISNGSSLPGTNYMTFTGTNVGIGTTSPGYDLVVNNTGNSILQIKAGDTSWSALYFGEQSSAYRGVVQYNHNSDFMAIYTTGNEVMRLDTSGKVGIGTTSPAGMLDIPSGSYTATKPALMLGGNIDTTGSGTRTDNTRKYSSIVGYHYSNEEQPVGIMSYDCQSDSVAVVNIGVPSASYNSPSQISFYTGATSITTSPTERMRILSDGEIVQGSSIADTYAPLVNGITADAIVCNRHSTAGSLGLWRTNTMEWKYYHNGIGYIMEFLSDGDIGGDFQALSDVNLKENISSVTDGMSIIKALRPVKYDWKHANKRNNQHGFIAQEVETALPTAVRGNDYVENPSGNPETEPADNGKTINEAAILAHAVKAIQELEARLAALE